MPIVSFMGRAERRRQLKFDEMAVDKGLNLTARDPRQLASLIRVLHEQVCDSVVAGSVSPLMTFLYENHSKTLKGISHIRLACQRGCSHCCHGWVSATAPEVFHVVNGLVPARLPTLREKIWTANTHTEDKSPEAREGIVWPCPLLEDHACSVYETRPVMCRSAVSMDAQICARSCLENSGENIPTPPVYFALSDGYTVALACALKKAGLQHRAFEYNGALKAAIGATDAEAQWLSGHTVFHSVIQDDDLLDDPWVRNLYAQVFA